MRGFATDTVRTTADLEREPIEHWVPQRSFRSLLEASVVHDPTSVAFRYHRSGALSGPTTEVTFRTAFERMRQTANALALAGLSDRDVVGLMMPLVPESHCVLFGAMAQVTALPLDHLLPPAQLADLLVAADARAVVVSSDVPDDPAAAARLVALRHLLPSLRVLVFCRPGETGPLDGTDLRRLLSNQPNRWTSDDRRGPRDVIALFPSGSTGQSNKLVRHTFEMYRCAALNHRVSMGYGPDQRLLTCFPLSSAPGALDAGLFAYVNGTSIAIGSERGFNDRELVRNFWVLAEEERTTIAVAPPAALADWARNLSPRQLPELAYVTPAGGVCPGAIARALSRALGKPVIDSWGTTETAGLYAALPLDGEPRVGSVGFPGPYCQLSVVEPDAEGEPSLVVQGETGEVVVRGPQVTPGFVGPDDGAMRLADGWFRTGDIGRIDDDGYLWIVGRIGERNVERNEELP